MSKKIYLSLIFLIVFSFTFFYQKIVFDFKGYFLEVLQTVRPSGENINLEYDLPNGTPLLLKTKVSAKAALSNISFNNHPLIPAIKKCRTKICTLWFYIPGNYILSNRKNNLAISFLETPDLSTDIRLYNYRRKINNDLYILFNGSWVPRREKFAISLEIASFFIILIIAVGAILKKIVTIPWQKIVFFLLLIIPNILLGILYFLLGIPGFKYVMTYPYFVSLQLVLIFITFFLLLLFSRSYAKKIFTNSFLEKLGFFQNYYANTPLPVKFIFLFFVLLTGSAIFLCLSLDMIAEQLSNIAYFSILTGVAIFYKNLY